MFNLNPNHKRYEKPDLSAYPDCHFDYAKEFTVREDDYEGEIVDAVVVYAESQMVNTKKGAREDLTIVLIDGNKNRFKAKFYGELHKEDGTVSDLSDRTYDFIKMATRQKQTNVNEGALTYKAFDSEKTIYPAMCGVKTKAVIARTGTYQGYATNAVELFNPDGRSEVELEQGITLAQDIMNKQRELKARYVKFKSENTAPQPAQGGYGGSYTTVDIRPTASVRAEVEPDDDIPF